METNLYLILELPLDPPEFPVCDEGKIEDAIKRKRPEWGKMSTGMGEMAQEAKKYISLIPEIRRKAKDPVEWSKESQAAQRLKAEREKEINRKTDEYILMMVRKNRTILKEDLKKTAKMLGVDEAFVHNRMKELMKQVVFFRTLLEREAASEYLSQNYPQMVKEVQKILARSETEILE